MHNATPRAVRLMLAGYVLLGAALPVRSAPAPATGPQFSVSFPKERSAQPLDGRILVLLSTDPSQEPRMQIDLSVKTQIIFGVDVDALGPGQPVMVTNDNAFGYPTRYLRDIPTGEYYVQALLHRYETFHRSDGHAVKLPMDRGEGQHWNLAPGNLYSKPEKLTLAAGNSAPIRIVMDQQIPPIPEPKDTKYIRHIKIKSELLSAFWGRPMYLGAHILVPEGFDEHPEAHFPLAVFHGHFPDDISGFRTEPPDLSLKPDYSERFHL